MNGLEDTYRAQVEFRSINANSTEGQIAFRFYALPGHPGFVILNPGGEVLWRGFGEQPKESIETEINTAITEWQSTQ